MVSRQTIQFNINYGARIFRFIETQKQRLPIDFMQWNITWNRVLCVRAPALAYVLVPTLYVCRKWQWMYVHVLPT